MKRFVAESPGWKASPPGLYQGRKAVIYMERKAGASDGDELFVAQVVADYSNMREVLYEGGSLPAAVAAVDRCLAEAEARGGMKGRAERFPRRMDLREVQRQFQLALRKFDDEQGVRRRARRDPIETTRCPLSALDDVQLLRASVATGNHVEEIYAATHDGRPAICRVEARERPGDQRDRDAEVTVYASADERLLGLADRRIFSEAEGGPDKDRLDVRELMREQYWLLGHGQGRRGGLRAEIRSCREGDSTPAL